MVHGQEDSSRYTNTGISRKIILSDNDLKFSKHFLVKNFKNIENYFYLYWFLTTHSYCSFEKDLISAPL